MLLNYILFSFLIFISLFVWRLLYDFAKHDAIVLKECKNGSMERTQLKSYRRVLLAPGVFLLLFNIVITLAAFKLIL